MKESKTLKKCQVHVLETKKSKLLKNPDGSIALITRGDASEGSDFHTPVHLYITSDEEIKEGDWCMGNGAVIKALKKEGEGDSWKTTGMPIYQSNIKKIIATTDPELYRGLKAVFGEIITPRIAKIPEDFISAYVREQGIKEINVEYTCGDYGDKTGLRWFPKLRPNGTIIIHKIEEKKYTRDELKSCLFQYLYVKHKYREPALLDWFNKKYPEC